MSSQKSMPVAIAATQVQRKFGEVVRRVYAGHEHFVVEKDGLPVMAIISMQEYADFMKEREQQQQEQETRLKQFEAAARALGAAVEGSGLSEEEVMAQVEAARERVHQRGYGTTPAK